MEPEFQQRQFHSLHSGPEKNRLLDIPPAKMGFFRIIRVDHHSSPLTAKEGEHFYKEEKDFGKAKVNKQSMSFYSLSSCQ